MKTYLLAMTLLVAFMSACTFNVESTANSANAPDSNKPANNAAPSNAKSGNKETDSAKMTEPPSEGKPERIQLAAGKTDASVTRTIPANGSLDFVLNAQSGKRLQYSVMYDNGSDTDIEVFLTEPGSQDTANTSAANENNEFMIKRTGDHRITVNNTTGTKASVRLGVSIK